MDKVTIEKTEKQQEQIVETQALPQPEKVEEVNSAPTNSYANSFEGQTIADVLKEREKKEVAEFEKEKEKLISAVYEKQPVLEKEPSQNIIEKPNYDLIEEPKKTLKIKKNPAPKKQKSKKLAGILLACVLGACGIVCVTNFAVLENLNNQVFQLEQTYQARLDKYLKDIANLDTTKKSMDFLDTYPDELLDAGSLGQKSNWFDRLCNFIAGLFGG